MSGLPPPAHSRAPLFIFSVAVAVGLLCARVPVAQPCVVLVVAATLSTALSGASVLFLRRKLFRGFCLHCHGISVDWFVAWHS